MVEESSFAKGLLVGCAVSLPMWAGIICVAIEVYRALFSV